MLKEKKLPKARRPTKDRSILAKNRQTVKAQLRSAHGRRAPPLA
jgi:hypothetical protein